mgnify:CR=1 FL=1
MTKAYDFEITLLARGFGACPEDAFEDALDTLEQQRLEGAIVGDVDFEKIQTTLPLILMPQIPDVQ